MTFQVFTTGQNLNDYFWHTLYIRRRADNVEVWVDDETKAVGIIGGENYNLKIDRIRFGSLGESSGVNNYIGYLQNFIYDGRELLGELRRQNTNVIWIEDKRYDNLPLLTYKPVTVTTSDTHFRLPTMRVGRTMKILFKFKTLESTGVILYNTGIGKDVIAVELSNGLLRLAYNLGGRNMDTTVGTPYKLNDNKWHTVQISLNEDGQFTVKVDATAQDVTTSDGNGRLDLQSGTLYIAGLPEDMFRRTVVTDLIESRKGFRGCLASMDINGAVPDLMNFATDRKYVLNGCTG
ncbi:MAG: LamG domain-containing protein [Candidatus Thiodiazotropha sp.]